MPDWAAGQLRWAVAAPFTVPPRFGKGLKHSSLNLSSLGPNPYPLNLDLTHPLLVKFEISFPAFVSGLSQELSVENEGQLSSKGAQPDSTSQA